MQPPTGTTVIDALEALHEAIECPDRTTDELRAIATVLLVMVGAAYHRNLAEVDEPALARLLSLVPREPA